MSLFLYQDQTFSIPPGRWKGFRLAGRQPVCTKQLAWSRNTTPIIQNCHGLSSFIIILWKCLSIFSYIFSTLQWHAMTSTIWEDLRGIPWIFSIRFSLSNHDFVTGAASMAPWLGDAGRFSEAMAPGHFTHASLYLCFVTAWEPGCACWLIYIIYVIYP